MPLPEFCYRCRKLKDRSLGEFIWRHKWERKPVFRCFNCKNPVKITRHRTTSASPLERRALRVLIDYGMPFDQEKPLEGFYYDFSVPSLNLLIEVDSPTYHKQLSRQRIDRAKDAVAKRMGWKLVRISAPDIEGKVQAALDQSFNELGLDQQSAG